MLFISLSLKLLTKCLSVVVNRLTYNTITHSLIVNRCSFNRFNVSSFIIRFVKFPMLLVNLAKAAAKSGLFNSISFLNGLVHK